MEVEVDTRYVDNPGGLNCCGTSQWMHRYTRLVHIVVMSAFNCYAALSSAAITIDCIFKASAKFYSTIGYLLANVTAQYLKSGCIVEVRPMHQRETDNGLQCFHPTLGAPLAQLVEHETFNLRAAGSSPARGYHV
jgi:hypothetical protein